MVTEMLVWGPGEVWLLEMSLVRGVMRGVCGVCEICMCVGSGGVGNVWVTE